jgi:hypothetical protein
MLTNRIDRNPVYLLISALLLLYFCSVGCGVGPTNSTSPTDTTTITLRGTYYVNFVGTSPADLAVTFTGCLLSNDGACSPQAADNVDKFTNTVTENLSPGCASVGSSCIFRAVPFLQTKLKPGRWKVTAESVVAAPVACVLTVEGGHTGIVNLNVFNSDPALRCSPATTSLPISQAFNIDPQSTLTSHTSQLKKYCM